MTKKITKCYVILGIACIIFLFYIGSYFDNKKYEANSHTIAEQFTDIHVIQKTKDRIQLEGTLPSYDLDNVCLGFQTLHQNIEIYVESEPVYRLRAGNNSFGNTTGWLFNFVQLKEEYKGKQISIRVDSIYGGGVQPSFYLGSELSLYLMVIRKNIIPFVLCVITIVLGLMMVLYWFYVHRTTVVGRGLLHIGTFGIVMGIWSINEIPITTLIFHGHVVSSYLSFVALMMLPIPFMLFVRDLYLDQNSKGWYIVGVTSLVNIILCLVMQVTNIMDMKRSLWVTHGTLLIFVIVLAWETIKEMHNGQLNFKAKVNMVCVVVDLLTLFLDLAMYYFKDGDSNTFGRIGFMIHIITLGWLATRDSASLIEKGRVAELYQTLAYRDQLTGLGNRTAFVEDMEKRVGVEASTSIIMLDLNDLKKCNDTLGHEAGDRYIQNAARMIDDSFRGNGKCYRIGGDEFCVILPSNSVKLCNALLVGLQDRQTEFNEKSMEEKVYMAWGYAIYNANSDKNLNDTRKRADIMMYQNKKKMKEGKIRSTSTFF